MFSFFKTKKSSPPSSPELDPIPSGSNDFVVVDQRGPNSDSNPRPLYPNFGGEFSGSSNMVPPLPGGRPPLMHSDSVQANYINGVPFKLSPGISTGDSDEITRIQVDDILALITSKMEITKDDYDFTLERSLLRQNEESDETGGTDETDATIDEAE